MAKINHNNPFEMIDRVIENAKEQKVVHLYAQDEFSTGGIIKIFGRDMYHFATTGYLGLELDPRLKNAAMDAVYRFGTQFPLSKTYVSHPLYEILEEKLEQLFKQPIVIAKNSTLAHLSAIPQMVENKDAVILDHQVHYSVQSACQSLKLRKIPVHMIRHNNMEQLEDFLIKFGNKYEKIWYMADGVYSMYGDFAPIGKLKALMAKYPSLYLYFDDVHGMSWMGKNGVGFVKSNWDVLPFRVVLVSTLSKTFGASGATIMSGNFFLLGQIKNFGGPLTFSAQLEPASIAAAIASADIHLSGDIHRYQNTLKTKMELFAMLINKYEIPLVSNGKTPVFYVAAGMPDSAYALVNVLQKEGFFVNPGIYPAVPIKNAGLRITISNHNSSEAIIKLADALNKHYLKTINKTNNSIAKIYRAFAMEDKTENVMVEHKNSFTVEKFDSIRAIDKEEWNDRLGTDQALDYDGMLFVENYFSGLPDDNPNKMVFKYYLIRDETENIVALSHISSAIWKQDMLAPVHVSEKIEAIRKEDPGFLTVKTLSTGSSFTEGAHLFVERNHAQTNLLLKYLLDAIEEDFEKSNCDQLILRDFKLRNYLAQKIMDRGYVAVEMPETAVFSKFSWNNYNDFEEILSKRSKRHFRKEVLPFIENFEVSMCDSLNETDLDRVFELYLNVKENNLAINNFDYDKSLFKVMNNSNSWKFLLMKQKGKSLIAGVMFCFINRANNSINPLLIGMEAEGSDRLILYRQLLFQTLITAKNLGFEKVYLGLSASFEKRKLGAEITRKEAYMQTKDNYAIDLLSSFE